MAQAVQRVLPRSVEKQLKDYRGKWIAIVGAGIVGHGKTPTAALRLARRKRPDTQPMLHWVPDDDATHYFF